MLFRDCRAEQPHFSHFAEDAWVGGFVTEGFQNAWHELALGILLGTVTHHALFLCELLIQKQRVDPVEACHASFLLRCALAGD